MSFPRTFEDFWNPEGIKDEWVQTKEQHERNLREAWLDGAGAGVEMAAVKASRHSDFVAGAIMSLLEKLPARGETPGPDWARHLADDLEELYRRCPRITSAVDVKYLAISPDEIRRVADEWEDAGYDDL